MSGKRPKPVFVDSCLLIEYFKDGSPQQDLVNRVYDLMNRATRGELVLVISTVVVAEVLTARHEVDTLLLKKRILAVEALNLKAAMIARDIALKHSVRPADACNIAVALHAECREFYTTDKGLIGKIVGGMHITEPPVPDSPTQYSLVLDQ